MHFPIKPVFVIIIKCSGSCCWKLRSLGQRLSKYKQLNQTKCKVLVLFRVRSWLEHLTSSWFTPTSEPDWEHGDKTFWNDRGQVKRGPQRSIEDYRAWKSLIESAESRTHLRAVSRERSSNSRVAKSKPRERRVKHKVSVNNKIYRSP